MAGPSTAARMYAPFPPFERWPVHGYHPSYGYCWFSRAGSALITQTQVKRADLRAAKVVTDWIDRAVQEERDVWSASKGLLILHDWRSLNGYDSDAKALVIERQRQRPKGYARRLCCVVEPTPLWRMALTISDLTLALLGCPPAGMTQDVDRARSELHGAEADPVAPKWLRTK
ncbi:MAG TPA: hypothetical protein VJV78_38885 [Polyangiales bacterium]|nr:hypothetical protein [Polyangiales bacterium]